jgi:hypothetical protein
MFVPMAVGLELAADPPPLSPGQFSAWTFNVRSNPTPHSLKYEFEDFIMDTPSTNTIL